MATAGDLPRYTFHPVERRGLIAGFQASQVATVAVACLLGLGVLRAVPTAAGMVGAAAVISVAGAGACWSIAGRPLTAWMPIGAWWLWRRLIRAPVSPQPLAGRQLGVAEGGAPLPTLAGLRILVAPAVPGGEPMAVLYDRRAGTHAVIIAVRGRSFSLLDPSDQQRRLGAWGAALAAMAREGSPIHRLQWIERTLPGDNEGLLRYLREASEADGPGHESYAELVAGAGPASDHHEVLVVLSVHGRRASRSVRTFGRGAGAVLALLRRELRLLQGQLRSAGLVVDRVFGEDDMAAALRGAVDPDAQGRYRRLLGSAGAWPLAADERWSTYRTDGAWHATYWVAEWPRVDVGSDFLAPLLLGADGRRTVAVTMAPTGPARAARQVEAARTADIADDELRRRAGFVTTARRRREAEGVLRREAELADGHADYRFSGYVTVSASDRMGLDTACAEIEQAASQARLELRRLYGRQEEAFTWTLPLGRGLS